MSAKITVLPQEKLTTAELAESVGIQNTIAFYFLSVFSQAV